MLLLDTIYTAGLILGSPYIAARLLFDSRYREGLGERFGVRYPGLDGDFRVWFHGASAGEVTAAQALYRLMKDDMPGMSAIFSTLTYTGKQAAERTYPDSAAAYFPIDLGCVTARALKRIRPHLVVLLEGDIWPNFVCAAKSLGAHIAVVNGRFSKKSVGRYKRLGLFFRDAFEAIDLFCLRDGEQADNITPLDIPENKIIVTGNIKYDNLQTELDETRQRLMNIMNIDPAENVVIAGSTHEGEEEPLLDIFAERGDFRLIIAPRYPHRADDVARLANGRNISSVRFSNVTRGEVKPAGRDLIIVDTIGDLADLYQTATIAFVGGSLIPRGGQNVLEPAALGHAVIFGKHTFTFKEEVEMLKAAGAAVEVADGKGLRSALSALLDDRDGRTRLGEKAREAILAKRGASKLTFDAIKELVRQK